MTAPDMQTDARRRYSVLSRIQGLLSPQQNGSPLSNDKELNESPGDNLTSAGHGKALDSKFLKIRVVTWNMHDSLPKGDLEDLLGKVPHYDASSAKPGKFPRLSNSSNHLFHLVVVAGQECPTPSGIPMGLAAGFKIGEKEREKPKNGIQDEKTDADVFEEEIRDNEKLPGWTQLVEDWLCNGIGSKTGSPSPVQIGTPKPLVRKKSCREPRKGPYQLLIKDRLMGIYLAVYIHRDLKPLVQGMSKSSVTAGLIGGRIGNKGGVGISLQLDGTTFLFLNAHLAAHEGKVNHRLANLLKIKTELDVDTFLAGDDARTVAEDLTDKFDFTFLFGDLNFRLDISRLHADWLISRQDYTQALEFDQLTTIMKKGVFFDGFCEAPINFPPTFKYDVSRPTKRRRRLPPEGQSPMIEGRHAEMEDFDEATDLISLASSITTVNSRAISESEVVDGYFPAVPSKSTIMSSNSKNFTGRPKWLSILSPSLALSPKFSKFPPFETRQMDPLTPTTPHSVLPTISPQSARTPKTSNPIKKRFLRPPPLISANFIVPQNIIQNEMVEEEKGVYDTSSKKRVPSWCDRILWKTTVPRPQQFGDLSPQSRRTRRVSQFFQSFRSPSLRTSSMEANGYWTPDQIPLSQPSSPTCDPDVQTKLPALTAIPPNKSNGTVTRRANTTFSPPPTAPLPSQVSPTMGSIDRPRSASIWRFLPAFLSPNASPEERQPPTPPGYIRGDVVCLSYGTLDDKGMRRLQGHSDHRPVVGAYAVYL